MKERLSVYTVCIEQRGLYVKAVQKQGVIVEHLYYKRSITGQFH